MTGIRDAEAGILTGISLTLQGEYTSEKREWEGSPFAWIVMLPPRQKGKIGEQLVAGWLAARGFNVTRSPDSDADIVIEGRRVEVKFSTLWATGAYKFQQLRDQNYDLAICLGISPFEAHCWVIPKENVLRLWKSEHMMQSQHGGASGSDTAWISVSPESVPSWLKPFGGSLSEGIRILSKISDFHAPEVREELEQRGQ